MPNQLEIGDRVTHLHDVKELRGTVTDVGPRRAEVQWDDGLIDSWYLFNLLPLSAVDRLAEVAGG